MRRDVAPVPVLAVLASALLAAQAPGPTPPTFRAGIDLVIVEATVVDRSGAVVRGLTEADFEVEIGGHSRAVVSADLVEHRAAAPADPAWPIPDVTTNTDALTSRTVLLVADQSSLAPDNRDLIEAARRWLRTLAPADRVGLVALPPPGPMVEFTTDHARVDAALGKVSPAGGIPRTGFTTRDVGLWEAIRISERDAITRGLVVERECRRGDPMCPAEIDAAARDIAADAVSRVRPILGSLRNVLRAMRVLPGPKHAVLLSGGWPLDPQAVGTHLEPVAAAAASASVMLHALLVERPSMEAFRRRLSPSSGQDRNMLMTSVESLAGWTGGQSTRVTGRGDGAFDALKDALAGFYRLGVRPAPEDLDGRSRRITVKVSRPGVSLRAHRRVFAADPVEPASAGDGDELHRALLSAAPQNDLVLRATSYILHEDASAPDRLRVLVAGDIAGGAPGAALVRFALFDENGSMVSGVERDAQVPAEGPAVMSAILGAPPGTYALRIAARDATGRIGNLQRDVNLRWRTVGQAETTDLALFHAGAAAGEPPVPVIDRVRRSERLVAQLAFSAPDDGGAEPSPLIEITLRGAPEPSVRERVPVARVANGSRWLAQQTVGLSALPPGQYTVAVTVAPGVPPLRRSIIVLP